MNREWYMSRLYKSAPTNPMVSPRKNIHNVCEGVASYLLAPINEAAKGTRKFNVLPVMVYTTSVTAIYTAHMTIISGLTGCCP